MKNKNSILIVTKAFFILLFICCFMSCNKMPKKKPFIIVDKKHCIWYWENTYKYQDANGNTYSFDDDWKKYSIGDTLK